MGASEALAALSDEHVAPNNKTGTLGTTVGHIFCAVVGAGVLGLPAAVAWLGWVAGPLLLVLFFFVSLWSSHMLAEVYCVGGVEFARYHHAVQHLLGPRSALAAAIIQCVQLVLVTLAYTITCSIAMRTAALRMGSSWYSQWQMTILVGAIELFMSQLPSFEEIWWVSAIGAISSLTYCGIALVLGCVYAKNGMGEVGGISASSAGKAFGVLAALGTLAFAYNFAMVLLEIQDTLRQPPHAAKTMKKAVTISISMAAFFYISVGCTGYAALGDTVPSEVLEGFTSAPAWTIVVANIAIAIHMLTAWQVFAQPMYETIESHLKARAIKREQKKMGLTVAKSGIAATSARLALAQPSFKPDLAALPEECEDGAVENVGADDSKLSTSPFLSPFDAALSRPAELTPSSGAAAGVPKTAGSAPGGVGALSADAESGALGAGLPSCPLGGAPLASVRYTSGGLAITNSCPVPTLLPLGGWEPKGAYKRKHSMRHSSEVPTAPGTAPESLASTGGMLAGLGSGRLGSAMYCVDTGLADESVPLNDQGYFAPLWERIIIRSLYVVAQTVLALLMPFFGPMVSLVGAIAFFPLSIYFPSLMWTKVYQPTGWKLRAIVALRWSMGVVSAAAVVGATRGLIVAWSEGFVLFAD